MKKGDVRRQQILERLADHVLAEGLQGASLRPLAAAAGTSDRMLLHYFVDKEALMSATLTVVTHRLVGLLAHVQAEPRPLQDLLPILAAMLKDDRIRPYMRLWLELVTMAAGGKEPFRAIAQQICTTFVTWIGAALLVEREEERQPLAALTLAIIEGLVVFDALDDAVTGAAVLRGMTLGPIASGRTPSRSSTSARGSDDGT